MSRQNNVKNTQIPSNLKDTLVQLEGTLSEWEKISPDEPLEISGESRLENEREVLEKELQKKARVILNQLKDQIEELSE